MQVQAGLKSVTVKRAGRDLEKTKIRAEYKRKREKCERL